MLVNILKDIAVVLASQSPRRKELLASMDVNFEVEVRSIDEQIPAYIQSEEAAEYVAVQKIAVFKDDSYFNKLIITADTVVVDADNNILGKPNNSEEAIQVLLGLSGKSHVVYTGVALQYKGEMKSFTCKTDVTFGELSRDEIDYYVQTYLPLDKAGSYGIQEWIGRIGVESIAGSFENVMGLPTSKLYQTLKMFL